MNREQRLVLESIVDQFPEVDSDGIPPEQIRLVRLSEEQVKVVREWVLQEAGGRGYNWVPASWQSEDFGAVNQGGAITWPDGYPMPQNGAPIMMTPTVDRPRQEFTVYGDGSGEIEVLPPYHFELPPNMFETNPIMQGSGDPPHHQTVEDDGLDESERGLTMRDVDLWQSEQEKADDLAALYPLLSPPSAEVGELDVENAVDRALHELKMKEQAASVAAYNRGVENALRQRAELEREAFLATWMDGPDEGGNERG